MVINVTVLDLPLNLVWNKSKGFGIVANFYHSDIYIFFLFFVFCFLFFVFFVWFIISVSAVHRQTCISPNRVIYLPVFR